MHHYLSSSPVNTRDLPQPPTRHDQVLVLCYHAVSPDWQAELAVTPQALDDQLRRLTDDGFQGVTFSDAMNGEVSGKVVAVTFDDGYRSVLERARPVLDRHGMPGTVFIPTDYPGKGPMSWPGIDCWIGTPDEQELLPLSWDETRELARAGWEIGSHTRSHPRLPQVSDSLLEDELRGSKAVLEDMLDRECRSLAYPYGDHDERVVEGARRAGYTAATTLPSRFGSTDPLSWPRVGVYHEDGDWAFRVKIAPAVRRLRSTRAGGKAFKVARRLLGRGSTAA